MTVAHRRVRTVVLDVPSASHVHRGATMLADALRTATLPGATPGRILIVRSLDVGDIRADASPASLALSIERRVGRLEAAAVSWDDAGAGRAPAVFFRDDAEPYVALALRLARHQPVQAWFWPLAVRAWRPAMSRDEALRALLFGILRTRAGVGGLRRLVDELGEADALEPVLGALRPTDGVALLRACGWSVPAAPVGSPRVEGTGRGGMVQRWIERWSAADARSIWLAAVTLAIAPSARLLDRHEPAALTSPRQSRLESSATPRDGDHAESSDNAGLLFAIPILARLGLAGFLESHQELVDLDLPRRVLDRLSERLGIPATDPVRLAAGRPVVATSDGRVEFVAPPRWFTAIGRRDTMVLRRSITERGTRILYDRSGRLPIALWRGRVSSAVRDLVGGSRVRRGRPVTPSPDVDVLVGAWLEAVRRWSRRHARMGLAELVRRPGRVAATRTHVDLVFDVRRADVRIRKAGLDLDPGWVPWLGRVLSFHYADE